MPDNSQDDPRAKRQAEPNPLDYPSNSYKSRAPKAISAGKQPTDRIKQEKIVSGEVIQRKKSVGTKLKEMFTGDDARSVGDYLVQEVLVPSLKSLLSDVASQGAERLLYGDSSHRRSSSRSSGSRNRSNFTNYRSMHERPDDRREISHRNRASHDFRDIVLETRAEAEDVIERLGDLVNQYDVATVGDLYDLVGITPDFTDNKWGWYDMRDAHVRPVRGGYLLNLPRTESID